MILSLDQVTRHIQAFFENDPGFVVTKIVGRESLSELFEYELTLFNSTLDYPVDPATVIGLGAGFEIDIEGQPVKR